MPPSRPEDIQGWMSSGELRWLSEQASRMSSIAEIGCWRGRSTYALLAACPGPVYAVDHWRGSRDELDHAHSDARDGKIYDEFLANVGHFPNLRVVRGDRLEVAHRVPVVDMVFIDACHAYEDVLADIKKWRHKARRLICGHDAGFDSVIQAVVNQFGRNVQIGVESIWCYEVDPATIQEVGPVSYCSLEALMEDRSVGNDVKCSNCHRTTFNSDGNCKFCGHTHESTESPSDLESLEPSSESPSDLESLEPSSLD